MRTITTDIESLGHLHDLLPKECIDECSCSGDTYAACEKWVRELDLTIPNRTCLRELKEVGAWDDEELLELDNTELNIRFLWLAAGYEA